MSTKTGPKQPTQESAPGRAWNSWLLRLVVSAVLLTLVIYRADASQVGILAGRASWGWWSIGLTLVLLVPTISAQRARLLIRGLGHRVSLGSVAAVNLEAIFFNLVLPGELAAGVVRWQRFSSHTGNRTAAFTVLAAERLIDLVVMALVACAGTPLLFTGESAPRLRLYTVVAASAVALLGGSALLVSRSRLSAHVLRAWHGRCGPRVETWVRPLVRLVEAGKALGDDASRTAAILFWTTAFWCIFFAGSVVMARAVFPPTPVLPYVAATAALVLLTQLPLTVAGVGLRELSLPVLLGAYGVNDELGLLLGVSAFVPYALLGATGFVLRLFGHIRLTEEADGASRRRRPMSL